MGFKGKAGFAGAGKMGGILIEGLTGSGMLPPENVSIFDIAAERLKQLCEKTGAEPASSVSELTSVCDVLFLCVKPDQFPATGARIAETWEAKRPVIVSIMAGVKTEFIRRIISTEAPVIRVMPNVAALVGKGAAGVAKDERAPDEVNEFVFDLFEKLGGAVWVPESKMDAVTALSGSGPAYVFMFIEALTDAGVRLGLDRQTSEKLAVRTVAGGAAMVDETDFDTLQLRAQVSSPGGTTVAATSELERLGFRSSIIESVRAAYERSVELGK